MKTYTYGLIFCLVCSSLGVATGLAAEKETAWISSGKLGGAVSLQGDRCLVGADAGEFDAMTLSLSVHASPTVTTGAPAVSAHGSSLRQAIPVPGS